MKNLRRLFFVRTAALAAGALALLAAPSHATFDFALTHTFGTGSFPLTWTATTDPSSTTAKVTYYVLSRFGFTNPLAGGTTVAVVFDKATIIAGLGSGSHCTVVRASTTVSGIFDTSTIQCHSYLHCGSGDPSCVARTDGNGTQLGFGQLWKWTYRLDSDSEMTVKIWKPGTPFYTDTATGFSTTTANPLTNLVKVLVSSVPRTGELDAGISNTETWDVRDASGTVVTNGIYLVDFMATNPLLTPTTRYQDVFTLPVDVLRIMNFTTVGISPTSSLASIKYDVTGDASVRIVIAQPGRKFTMDGSGLVQALNAAGTAVDTSSTSVVRVITFNRKAGTYSETWDGLDTLGVAVSSGVYTVGISAIDGFGNRAIDPGGNDGAQATTIPVERTASQTAADTTAPTISAITVNGTSIASGNPQFAAGTSFTDVVITLNETAGSGSNVSLVSLTAPTSSGGGTVANSGVTVTFSTAVAQTSTGTYTVQVTAKDTLGNTATPQAFTFSIQPGSVGGTTIVRQSEESFKKTVTSYPNPVRTGPAKFDFTLTVASTVDIDLYTLKGDRVFHQTQAFAAGANTFNWDLVNNSGSGIATGVYLLRITANDGQSTIRASRKVMVIR